MTYREIMKKYREGNLGEEEKRRIEEEIEKYEAISDYLFEEGEIPELEQVWEETERQSAGEREAEFVSLVNRSIRGAFRKLGVTVVAVTMAAVLFIQFCLPQIVSCFYYNPGKTVGKLYYDQEHNDSLETNQMSLDMAVYTELLFPAKRKTSVVAEARGYGVYDICITQNVSYNRQFNDITGEINRGKLRLYNPNLLKRPTGNCFVWFQVPGDLTKSLSETMTDNYNMCAAGTREQAMETLQELDDHQYYIGYVSLNRLMEYEEFYQYLSGNDELIAPWCAVITEALPEEAYGQSTDNFLRVSSNMGFQCGLSSSVSMAWDEEKYPELLLWNVKPEEVTVDEDIDYEKLKKNMESEAFMKQHFVSMLTYLANQREFLKMMDAGVGIGETPEYFLEAAQYVEENGITIYGFAAVMNKETALKLSEQEEVYEIYVEDLR